MRGFNRTSYLNCIMLQTVYPPAATFTLTNTRIYTIIARGYVGFTDANRKPNVSLLLNR